MTIIVIIHHTHRNDHIQLASSWTMDNLAFRLNTMLIMTHQRSRHSYITISAAMLSIKLTIITADHHNHHLHDHHTHQSSSVVIVILVIRSISIIIVIAITIIIVIESS